MLQKTCSSWSSLPGWPWFWCHDLCPSEIILFMLSMLLCVFCRVLAAPSSLSQPKPFHGPKNMSLAASTISSAISSQSRYICKPLFFEPNRFWFCIMLFDMRFSVSEGIDLAEKKELPFPYVPCDNPARKHVNVGYVTTRSSWNTSVSPGWFMLLLPSWNENICLETLGENDGPFFFLGENRMTGMFYH